MLRGKATAPPPTLSPSRAPSECRKPAARNLPLKSSGGSCGERCPPPRYVYFGAGREHAAGAFCVGLSAYGGIVPYWRCPLEPRASKSNPPPPFLPCHPHPEVSLPTAGAELASGSVGAEWR